MRKRVGCPLNQPERPAVQSQTYPPPNGKTDVAAQPTSTAQTRSAGRSSETPAKPSLSHSVLTEEFNQSR